MTAEILQKRLSNEWLQTLRKQESIWKKLKLGGDDASEQSPF